MEHCLAGCRWIRYSYVPSMFSGQAPWNYFCEEVRLISVALVTYVCFPYLDSPALTSDESRVSTLKSITYVINQNLWAYMDVDALTKALIFQ
jgi:hypothetical protein